MKTKPIPKIPTRYRPYVRQAFAHYRAPSLYFTQEHNGHLLAFSSLAAAVLRQRRLNACFGMEKQIITYHQNQR